MVWAGIWKIIGPYFFGSSNVTGKKYFKVSTNFLFECLENVTILRQHFFFHQDGAPLHFAITVRNYLDQTFLCRCIGQRGPVE